MTFHSYRKCVSVVFCGRSNVVIKCLSFVLQAERTDPLTVGLSHERKTELLESILQPFIL